MTTKTINVLQFITPVGFYGAERWVLALINNSDPSKVRHDLAVTDEPEEQDLEILNQFPKQAGESHRVVMTSRFDLSAINELVKIIKTREIDVIHTHGYKSDILGFIAAKKVGIKCVSTPHGFGQPSNFKLKMFIKLGTLLLRFFDKVVPLSKQLEEEAYGFGVPKNKVVYIQNGVDLTEVERYRLTKKAKLASDKKIIGFIGQMIPRKNIKDLLDIFESVHRVNPNVILQLLGDGESRQEMEEYAQTLSSLPDIHFLGFRHDRMDYLKQFDIFAMTSKDEGIPRCLMEAMGMELSVAAYDIAGIDQLVTHNKTGLLAEFGDKKTLTQYWLDILSDEQKAIDLAKNAKSFVDDKFSAHRMAIEYTELFTQLLKK